MDIFTADAGWLLFSYVVGTAFGLYVGYRANLYKISESVIDSLIEQKYLKTRGHGENLEILKYTEWCSNDQTSK